MVNVTDARLVTIWGEMRKAGFTEEFGFTPALLSYYAQPATEIGQQEARLFMERTDGRMDTELAAEMVQKALPLMLDFFGLIPEGLSGPGPEIQHGAQRPVVPSRATGYTTETPGLKWTSLGQARSRDRSNLIRNAGWSPSWQRAVWWMGRIGGAAGLVERPGCPCLRAANVRHASRRASRAPVAPP